MRPSHVYCSGLISRSRSAIHLVSQTFSSPALCLAFCFSLKSSAHDANFYSASGVTSQVYGHADTSKYPVASFTFDSDETVKNAILYGDGHGNWLGHIYLETSKGRTFDAGRDTKNIDPYSIDVGGGLLLGAVILTRKPDKDANEDDVSKLGLLFLGQPIDHITIQDIKFTEDPSGSSSGIEPQNVVVGKWFNHDVNKVGYSLTPTYGVTSSYS